MNSLKAFPNSKVATISGHGLITGKPVNVSVRLAQPGSGIVFQMDGNGSTGLSETIMPATLVPATLIPATLASVVHTDRGVTLADSTGQAKLSIVEHFLAAASLTALSDLIVTVDGAPELPILDGSAAGWVQLLQNMLDEDTCLAGDTTPENRHVFSVPVYDLPHAVVYRHNPSICLYALPDTHFKLTYSVDFNHPDLESRWAHWDSQADDLALISQAGTFGYMEELPALQAKGFALGASLENSLGLTRDGGYTRALRYPDEPIYHKMLDCIGDLRLMGLNPLGIKAHVYALNAGHTSHIAFAHKLLKHLHPTHDA
jgi:UDP-3-O-[3-hydroxymyristoyl] N-acetylglucosamine deacetylase